MVAFRISPAERARCRRYYEYHRQQALQVWPRPDDLCECALLGKRVLAPAYLQLLEETRQVWAVLNGSEAV